MNTITRTVCSTSNPMDQRPPAGGCLASRTRFILGLALTSLLFTAAGPRAVAQTTDVLTYHNDNARTGQYLVETNLTPARVNSAQFGKLWTLNADGKVDAEPLYAAGVAIPGKGLRNMLFIATEHGTVYGYDADSTNLLWQISMLGAGEVPSDDHGCNQVTPEIGVTATPVIDRQLGPSGTMFVVAMSKNTAGTTYFQRLHALDLATGTNRVAPMLITGSYPGIGDGTSGGNVIFAPGRYKERPGLLLLGGLVYTAWSSHCDARPYTGWIMSYDENTLAQTSVLDFTPNGNEGAVWMSGAGMAVDASSNIFFLAANGTFDATLNTNGFPSQGDFGNAFIKLSTLGNSLTITDYFATYTNSAENNTDLDLGSGGALVLPDMLDAQNNVRQLAVGAGKDKNIFLVDRTNMGKFNATNNNAVYQELSGALSGAVFSMPAYFNGTLYFGAVGDHIKAFPFQSARLTASSSQSSGTFAFPGATPSISANGSNNGIVWVAENTSPAVLHAYAATNLATELYNSNQATTNRDHFGVGNKFITPMIANGKVYVGTTTGVGVFGLLSPPLSVQAMAYVQQPGNTLVGTTITPEVQVKASGTNGQPVSGAAITLSLGSGTGTLSGTLTQATDLNGIAHFNDLSINQGGLKVLTATAGIGAASPTNSNPFTIILPATGLAFTIQPGAAVIGAPFGQQPVLRTVDQLGNPTIAGLPATVTVNVNVTNGSGTLLGTTSYNIGAAGSNGVVSFTNLEIDAPGSDQLFASTSGAPSNSVPGAVLWLDASDLSTLTTNTTKVQAWKNKGIAGAGSTGTNLWFTQNNTALQPTIQYASLNGRPVVRFSDHGSGNAAGNDFLGNIGGKSYTNSGSQMTYFLVTRQTVNTSNWRGPVSFSANGQIDGKGTAGVAILADGSQASPYPLGIQRNHTPTPMQADIPVPAAGTAFLLTFVDNAGTASLYATDINGVNQTNGANIVNGLSPYVYAITDVTVGGRLEPDPTTVDNGWPGDIAEVLVYNTALSTTDRATVENYLKAKWFVAGGSGTLLGSALSLPFVVQASGGGTPPPQNITNATVDHTTKAVTLTYATTANFSYHVEVTASLVPTSWATVPGSATNAPGTSVTFTDTTTGGGATRFYRIVSP